MPINKSPIALLNALKYSRILQCDTQGHHATCQYCPWQLRSFSESGWGHCKVKLVFGCPYSNKRGFHWRIRRTISFSYGSISLSGFPSHSQCLVPFPIPSQKVCGRLYSIQPPAPVAVIFVWYSLIPLKMPNVPAD